MDTHNLRLTRRQGDWWIVARDLPDWEDCGPYATKKEAEEDRRGLLRFFRWGHLHKFWTVEKET